MSGIRITGYKEIRDRGDKIISDINGATYGALSKAADVLSAQARENVRNWSMMPGLSQVGGSITDEEHWIKEPIDWNELVLHCTSEHAAFVEFCGLKFGPIIYAKGKGMPIGQQQFGYDENAIIRKQVKIQEPMGYLGGAIDMSTNMMLLAIRDKIHPIIGD
jgi:hypothetical protein